MGFKEVKDQSGVEKGYVKYQFTIAAILFLKQRKQNLISGRLL